MDRPIYMIGNAHIDPVWLWQWQDGFAEIKATFRAALDRMDEFPEFVFTSGCAAYYAWVEGNAPELFAEIQKRVAEGRFVIVGGLWIQPDCNIPSGESFCRQALYSQRYFQRTFGQIATVGYNVDSFGHNGMLPQILKKSGMDSYVFMRPNFVEKDIPVSLFRWQSPDGSGVTAFRIPMSYGDWFKSQDGTEHAGLHPTVAKILETEKLRQSEGLPMMCFYGVGNHGGGPTIQSLRAIEAHRESHPGAVEYTSPREYFDGVAASKDQLQVVGEDLQHHASGCYSANGNIKQLNRKAENRLLTAEKLMTSAYAALGHPYDAGLLGRAWEKLMFNQFHDILAGCCIKEACVDAVESFHESISIAAELANSALQKISWSVDTTGGSNPVLSKESDWMLWEQENRGVPVILFNPHSFPVRTAIRINKALCGVTDKDGNPLPIQKVRGSQTNGKDIYNTLFMAQLPAMGYTTCWIFKERTFPIRAESEAATAQGNCLENEYIRVEIDPATGDIASIFSKTRGAELLSAPAGSVVIDETDSDTWAHAIFEFSDEVGRFAQPTITVLETGPIRARIRVEQRFRDTILRQDYSLLAGTDRIDVGVRMDIRLRHQQIKLCFPLALQDPRPVYSMPYGFLTKAADGLEEPGQQWVAAADGSGPAFALINDGKYSFSMKGNTLRMMAARTPAYADHFGERDDDMEYTDQGISEFQYGILPGEQGFAQIVREARLLNQPPEQLVETYHRGPLGPEAAGIAISSPQVIAEVFKRSEEGDGYILRLFEAGGAPADRVEITCQGRTFALAFAPQEIKTIFLPDNKSQAVEERMIIEF